MQDIEKPNNRSSFSKSKLAMIAGIVVLLGVIGLLVYLSQPKTKTSAQLQIEKHPKRTKESIGVYSRFKSRETEAGASKGSSSQKSNLLPEPVVPVEVLKGETDKATVDTSTIPAAGNDRKKQAVAAQTERSESEKQTAKSAKVSPALRKKHRRSEETFFELAPNSGKHAPDNLDRVAD